MVNASCCGLHHWILKIHEIHLMNNRYAIQKWRKLAILCVMADDKVLKLAREAMMFGINEYDALHVASAIVGKADIFVTTDDRLIKCMRQFDRGLVLFPVEAVAYLEKWYEN